MISGEPQQVLLAHTEPQQVLQNDRQNHPTVSTERRVEKNVYGDILVFSIAMKGKG